MRNNFINNDVIDEILNKNFTVEFKGYDSSAVDEFLDYLAITIKNYQQELVRLNKLIKEQKTLITDLEKNLSKSHEEVSLLKSQKQALEAKGLQNVDIITRLSKLERIVNED